ncbi:MAG: ABC transporter ATP-binding protein [Betaproteobacteria bacterium RIFCSPLOWO2_02_FULL_62_17]|nr:MAG: ABC transporter ATP-binding protein [Betaproteobacteria bacterium RIFCSPLOWO2_02_FULL_62_17]
MAETLLELKSVRAGYGDAVVLDDISLQVTQGENLAVLGRNGMGKSTLFLTIMGFTRLTRGSIEWQSRDITRLASHRRARLGLGWVAQEREIFPSLTVEENLTVMQRPGPWNLKKVFDLFPRLAERSRAMGNQLSGGEQQMLAIARSLMTNPTLLLLDEPLEGLAPILVEELAAAIGRMAVEQGTTIVLIEQHADVALSLTRRALVLERGAIVHSAASEELSADAATLDRYLGLKLESAGD